MVCGRWPSSVNQANKASGSGTLRNKRREARAFAKRGGRFVVFIMGSSFSSWWSSLDHFLPNICVALIQSATGFHAMLSVTFRTQATKKPALGGLSASIISISNSSCARAPALGDRTTPPTTVGIEGNE
jgi:hypothetical protein